MTVRRNPVLFAALILMSALGTCFASISEAQTPAPDDVDEARAQAGETADEPRDEPPVFRETVEVSRSPIVQSDRIDRAGSLVTAVDERQIDDLNAQNLSSALRRIPGVVISRYNLIGTYGGGDGGAVFIRGHGSGRPGAEIGTLTDGIPRFVGVWTHPLLDGLSLDPAGKIEVYRSAQPVLFGNMAFGAVNMISNRWTGADGAGGRLVLTGGEHDTRIARAEAGGRSGRLDWYVTAATRSSDGHRADADGEVTAFSGRLGWRFDEHWDLSIRAEDSDGWANDPRPVGAAEIPVVPRYDTESRFYLATLNHRHGDRSGFVKLYLEDGLGDWLQWDDGASEAFQSVTDWRNWGVRLQEALAPWDGGTLVVGLDHDIYGGEFVEHRPDVDRLATDLDFRSTAPYVLVSHAFEGAARIVPSVGVRWTDTRYFDTEWGAQAGLRVELDGATVYANAAHAFNLPGVWAAVQYGGWGRGDQWRDLEAETVDHTELGVLTRLADGVDLRVSVFNDEVENALRFVPPPPPPPLFANIGAYTSRGVEATVQLRPADGLRLFVGATATDTDPQDVPNAPEATASAGLAYVWGRGWRINLDGQYVDERYVLNPRFAPGQTAVDAYLLLNGRLAAPLGPLGLGLDGELFAAVENLTDEAYEYRPGYPMPGRTVMVGTEVRF